MLFTRLTLDVPPASEGLDTSLTGIYNKFTLFTRLTLDVQLSYTNQATGIDPGSLGVYTKPTQTWYRHQ